MLKALHHYQLVLTRSNISTSRASTLHFIVPVYQSGLSTSSRGRFSARVMLSCIGAATQESTATTLTATGVFVALISIENTLAVDPSPKSSAISTPPCLTEDSHHQLTDLVHCFVFSFRNRILHWNILRHGGERIGL